MAYSTRTMIFGLMIWCLAYFSLASFQLDGNKKAIRAPNLDSSPNYEILESPEKKNMQNERRAKTHHPKSHHPKTHHPKTHHSKTHHHKSHIHHKTSKTHSHPSKPTTVAGYTSEGCYQGFFLSNIHFDSYNLITPKLCAKFCKAYPYFSLENGVQCDCGNSISGLTTSSGCTTACSGNPKQICGGFSRKNIYYNKNPTAPQTPLPGGFQLEGCYNGGTLDGPSFANSSNSVEFCATFCQGYLYMALEDGEQCSCGTTTPNMTPQTQCTTDCSANNDEYCGGFGQKNLYVS